MTPSREIARTTYSYTMGKNKFLKNLQKSLKKVSKATADTAKDGGEAVGKDGSFAVDGAKKSADAVLATKKTMYSKGKTDATPGIKSPASTSPADKCDIFDDVAIPTVYGKEPSPEEGKPPVSMGAFGKVGGSVLGGAKSVGGSVAGGANAGVQAVRNVGGSVLGGGGNKAAGAPSVDGDKDGGKTLGTPSVQVLSAGANAIGKVGGNAVQGAKGCVQAVPIIAQSLVGGAENATMAVCDVGGTAVGAAVDGSKKAGSAVGNVGRTAIDGTKTAAGTAAGTVGGVTKKTVVEVEEATTTATDAGTETVDEAKLQEPDTDTPISSITPEIVASETAEEPKKEGVVSELKSTVTSTPTKLRGGLLETTPAVGGGLSAAKKTVAASGSKAEVPAMKMDTGTMTDSSSGSIVKETVPTAVSPSVVLKERLESFIVVKNKFKAKASSDESPVSALPTDGLPAPEAVVATKGTTLARSGNLVEGKEGSEKWSSEEDCVKCDAEEEREKEMSALHKKVLAVFRAHEDLGEKIKTLADVIARIE